MAKGNLMLLFDQITNASLNYQQDIVMWFDDSPPTHTIFYLLSNHSATHLPYNPKRPRTRDKDQLATKDMSFFFTLLYSPKPLYSTPYCTRHMHRTAIAYRIVSEHRIRFHSLKDLILRIKNPLAEYDDVYKYNTVCNVPLSCHHGNSFARLAVNFQTWVTRANQNEKKTHAKSTGIGCNAPNRTAKYKHELPNAPLRKAYYYFFVKLNNCNLIASQIHRFVLIRILQRSIVIFLLNKKWYLSREIVSTTPRSLFF